jgi:hypothetical protein
VKSFTKQRQKIEDKFTKGLPNRKWRDHEDEEDDRFQFKAHFKSLKYLEDTPIPSKFKKLEYDIIWKIWRS